jgi:hypothetical protein
VFILVFVAVQHKYISTNKENTMKTFIEFLKSLFRVESISDNLEAYIIAGNPQDVGDVDRLEREFYNRNYAMRPFGF